MAAYRKSREELEVELKEQIEGFRLAAKTYDEGTLWAAKDLSSYIHKLLHDAPSGRTTSLLKQVGLKAKLRLLSSLVVPPSATGGKIVAAQATPLLITRISDSGSVYVPAFDDHPLADQYRWLQFNRWWEERVFHPLSAFDLSRKNLIFTMRDQDGGGHVDPTISNADYVKFKKDGDPLFRQIDRGVVFGEGAVGEPVANGLPATIRQIAWELDQSLIKLGL
jgi:hypothetical protein